MGSLGKYEGRSSSAFCQRPLTILSLKANSLYVYLGNAAGGITIHLVWIKKKNQKTKTLPRPCSVCHLPFTTIYSRGWGWGAGINKDTNIATLLRAYDANTLHTCDLMSSSLHPYEMRVISHSIHGQTFSDRTPWPWASQLGWDRTCFLLARFFPASLSGHFLPTLLGDFPI